MIARVLRSLLGLLLLAGGVLVLNSCGSGKDTSNEMVVSVRDQRMLLTHEGVPVKSYAVSTSKFGLGSQSGSYRTPLGDMEVAKKIGGGAPTGMVFKSRRATGEILRPNAPGRDPIVSRIMWLKGNDYGNSNTFGRMIYIHGTPEERNLGKPASYGCIRMGMRDVVELYDRIGEGAQVRVIRGPLVSTPEGRVYARMQAEARKKQLTARR